MGFLYISPEDFRQRVEQEYGPNPDPGLFRVPGSDDPTQEGANLINWMYEVGQVDDFKVISRWIGGSDSTTILCFGPDYDILRDGWPEELRSELDDFYGPARSATYRPSVPVIEGFDCPLLKALGVQFAYTPDRARQLLNLGQQNPFASLLCGVAGNIENVPCQLRQRYGELLSDPSSRDLLRRYDALSHILCAAFRRCSQTGIPLLATNFWS